MENKLDFVQTVNRLIDSDHIVICGHPVLVECQRVRKLTTDGVHLWAIGVSGTCAQVPATCVTDAWFYDLTDGKVIYGSIPVSNFVSKSSPDQEIP
jgi:NAD(P)H-flavin reductase